MTVKCCETPGLHGQSLEHAVMQEVCRNLLQRGVGFRVWRLIK